MRPRLRPNTMRPRPKTWSRDNYVGLEALTSVNESNQHNSKSKAKNLFIVILFVLGGPRSCLPMKLMFFPLTVFIVILDQFLADRLQPIVQFPSLMECNACLQCSGHLRQSSTVHHRPLQQARMCPSPSNTIMSLYDQPQMMIKQEHSV